VAQLYETPLTSLGASGEFGVVSIGLHDFLGVIGDLLDVVGDVLGLVGDRFATRVERAGELTVRVTT
jgi:hypothetical protein